MNQITVIRQRRVWIRDWLEKVLLFGGYLGNNNISASLNAFYPNPEFSEQYLNVEEAVFPIEYGYTEQSIQNDLEAWRTVWLVIVESLDMHFASLRAQSLENFAQKTLGAAAFSDKDLKRIRTTDLYVRWKSYIDSLDLKHPYIGCEIPEYLLERTVEK